MIDNSPNPDSNVYPLGTRIAIFGKGGKTTLALALAKRFNLEFVELDSIRHLPGWTERPDDEMRSVLADRLDGAKWGWVTDGNYRITRRLILERADTAIVLALPWRVMLWRTLKRSWRRAVRREELWNGNRESFLSTFFSKHSVVYDLWFRRHHFRNMAEEFSSDIPADVTLKIVRTTRELEDLYGQLGLDRR